VYIQAKDLVEEWALAQAAAQAAVAQAAAQAAVAQAADLEAAAQAAVLAVQDKTWIQKWI
jgi:hypothetical protein